MDSMTELERRCYNAASYAIGADGCPTLDIVKAVLAEAGVAELVELLTRYHNETPLGHQPHMIADKASALLAKIGANQ